MIGRFQRAFVYGIAVISVLWAGVCLRTGLLPWLAAPLVLVAIGYGGTIALELTLMRLSYRDLPNARRPTLGRLIRVWLLELMAGPLVFFWRQPFRSNAFSDRLSSGGPSGRGVVFIHGFFCNRGVWNPWLWECQRRRVAFAAVNLEPPFAGIDAYVPAVDSAVEAMWLATGTAPVIVAHSMGGLVARAWLAARQVAEAAPAVHRIVTIGSPHHGTALARFATTANGRQMAVGSAWLRSLEQREFAESRSRFICYWSDCDNIVFPTPNATLPGADNRHVAGAPHVHLADHPAIRGDVFALLSESPVS